jgi:hypothetical protein
MWVPRATCIVALVAAVGPFALGASSANARAPAARSASSSHHAAPPAHSVLRLHLSRVRGGHLNVAVWTSHGSLHDVSLVLRRNGEFVQRCRLTLVTPRHRTVVFTVRQGGGRLSVSVIGSERRSAHRTTTQTTSTTSP